MDVFAHRSKQAAALCEPNLKYSRVCVPAGCSSPQLRGPVLAEGLLQGAAFRCEGDEECLSPALLSEAGSQAAPAALLSAAGAKQSNPIRPQGRERVL